MARAYEILVGARRPLISMGCIFQQRHNILTIPPHLHARVERVVLDDDGVVLHGILLLLRVRPRNAGDAALVVHFEFRKQPLCCSSITNSWASLNTAVSAANVAFSTFCLMFRTYRSQPNPQSIRGSKGRNCGLKQNILPLSPGYPRPCARPNVGPSTSNYHSKRQPPSPLTICLPACPSLLPLT